MNTINEITIQAKKAANDNVTIKQLLKQGWQKTGFYEYQDKNENPIYWRIRLDPPINNNDNKWIRPLSFDGKQWVLKEPDLKGKKPLYLLPSIIKNPNAIVYLVEGEKCANALSKLGVITTTSGGAGSVNNTNWDYLKIKKVIIWRDNDDAGLKYAQEVTKLLLKIGCSVQWIDIDKLDLLPKGDCVDWLARNPHATKSNIEALPLIEPKINESSTSNQISQQQTELSVYSGAGIFEKAVLRLSKLPPVEYEQVRTTEAKRLKVRISFLDQCIQKNQAHIKDNKNDDELTCGIEPWSEQVNGLEIANNINNKLKNHIVLSNDQSIVITLWVFGSYCFEAFSIFPKLLITSPEKRCGKSTVMRVLYYLSNQSLLVSNITPAAIFRGIELWQPTLLIDEADTFIKGYEELRGIINSGHSRDTAFIMRVEGDGNNRVPKKFSTWSPMAIAMIKNPADTILDRSVIIKLRRKMPNEQIERLEVNSFSNLKPIRQKLKRWGLDNMTTIQNIIPEIPKSNNDRAIDNWLPLFAIADTLGGEWPQKIKTAFINLNEIDDSECLTTLLLGDIKSIFDEIKVEKIHSEFLVEKLMLLEDRPWNEYWHGRPITKYNLSKLLKPFGIKPKQTWIGNQNKNGYQLANFKDAFKRYLPLSTDQNSKPLDASTDADLEGFINSRIREDLEFPKTTEAAPDKVSRVLESEITETETETNINQTGENL